MSKRIIVAEDDRAMRELVAGTLRNEGYEVVEIPDGGRLLVLLTRCMREADPMPDAIVSDVRMPVMTGLAMLKSMRDAHLRVPIVLMTAFPDRETVRRAEALDASVLMKPFLLAQLRLAVVHALRNGR